MASQRSMPLPTGQLASGQLTSARQTRFTSAKHINAFAQSQTSPGRLQRALTDPRLDLTLLKCRGNYSATSNNTTSDQEVTITH